MAESSEQLKVSLARLHAQLSTTPTIDPEARQLLEAVLHDIADTLARSGDAVASSSSADAAPATPPSASDEPATLQERLTASARHFEAEHPTLAGAVENVLHALSRLGI